MIVAAVDDLLFSSKIRTAAKQLGVELIFARTPADILEQARTRKPRLLIVDLDSERIQPIATVASLKQDPELAGIRTLGFVSHVHAQLIEAARTAGADEVLPRSGFVANLPAILEAGR